MFPIEAFQNTLLKVVAILQRHGIPFHLTGGVTAVAYSEPRFTQDIDIVLQNEAVRTRLASLLDSLEQSDFLFDRTAIETAVASSKMFQLFDAVESLKLDMYPREMIPGELSRSASAEIFEGISLPIVSRFDAAASKLMWINKGSHKSRRDLRQLMSRLSDAEESQLREFAADSDLGRLLEEVLSESDEIEE